MIDADGRLLTAVSDICPSYDPDKENPTVVESARSGPIFKCRAWTQSQIADLGIGACLGCGRYDEHKAKGELNK